MDIPTVKDQVAASQPERKSAPAPVKSREELLKGTIKNAITAISPQNPSVKRAFVGPVPNEVVTNLVDAGYDVDYSCSYVLVKGEVSVASTLTIINPVFKTRKEEEERQSKKDLGSAMSQLLRGLGSQDVTPGNKQYYDIFAGILDTGGAL